MDMAKKSENTHCFKHELKPVSETKIGAFTMDLDIS